MAFNPSKMKSIGGARKGEISIYTYDAGDDSLADVSAAGYFDVGGNSRLGLEDKDIIHCYVDGELRTGVYDSVTRSVEGIEVGIGEAAMAIEKIPTDANGYDIILLIGQSNMVGRYGPVDPVLDASDPRIFQYGVQDQTIRLATDPLDHWNENPDNIGLGLTIAKQYLATLASSTRKVMIIPAASGNSGFSSGQWDIGGNQREWAKTATNAVIANHPNSRLVAICWHQGESDAAQTTSYYSGKLSELIAEYRAEITGAENVPFILGKVPDWSTAYSATIRLAHERIPRMIDNTALVETDDLTDGGDSLHFDAASLRTMGTRYADKLAILLSKDIGVSERDAVGHWILNESNPNYLPSGSGNALSEVNVAPTLASNYLTFGSGNRNGLDTGFVDAHEQTMCVVYRVPAATAASDAYLLSGTITAGAGDGGSGLTIANNQLKSIVRTNSTVNHNSINDGDVWIFAALSEKYGLNQVLRGNFDFNLANARSKNLVSEKTLSGRTVAVGNAYYIDGSFYTAFDVAEFIVFDKALSMDEMKAVYERSVVRLGALGIEVV